MSGPPNGGQIQKRKKIPYIVKKRLRPNLQLIEQDIKYSHWAMFKHVVEFWKQCTSLKTPFPKHYFISILKDISNNVSGCADE
jgi:hypothetical protein